MIKFRLGVLLAQMGYRQDDVAQATKISKNTLSNIVNNKTSGIQNDNLQKIALFLNVDISELFEYYPVMYSFLIDNLKIGDLAISEENYLYPLTDSRKIVLEGITLRITRSSLETNEIPLSITPLKNNGSFSGANNNQYIALISSYRDVFIDSIMPDSMEDNSPFNPFNEFLKDVPTTFLPDIKNSLQKFIHDELIANNDEQWLKLFPDSKKDVLLILGENKPNKRFVL